MDHEENIYIIFNDLMIWWFLISFDEHAYLSDGELLEGIQQSFRQFYIY